MKKYFKGMIQDMSAILRMIADISKSFLPVVLITNILQAALPFVNILFGYLILDGIVGKHAKEAILNNVYWMLFMNLILGILVSFLSKYINVQKEYINRTIHARIAQKALSLDYEQLENQDCLQLLHKAKEGSNSHGDFISFSSYLGRIMNSIMSLIYSVIILSSLFKGNSITNESVFIRVMNSPWIVILLFSLFLLALIMNFRILKRMNDKSYAFFEKNVDINRQFGYFINLGNNYKFGKDIRLYHMAGMIKEEIDRTMNPASETILGLGKIYGKCNGLKEVINQGTNFLIYGYIGVKAILGLLTVGSVLKYVSTLMKFMSCVSEIISIFADIDLQRQYLKNYYIFLQLENKKYEGTLPIEKRNDNDYELEFNNVSFRYPNSEEMILKDISLKLKVGHKMAIVGRNGAGKTTFIKLLNRLYDPTEGEILLNGINIKKYDYEEYLKIFSVVFQDFKLFSFDIGQNVAASVSIDEDKAWKALVQAGIAERVKGMEEGLKTNLYQTQEDGIEISGGEAQKLAIARALYKDAPLVILDEPTSALDPVSEYEIYAKFDELVSDKTSIYISHRMSSCRFCDNIIVFDQGRIAQIGSHDTLMKEEAGIYHALWSAQAKYYTA
ncbi:MAG: transporter related [Herbinix sp.]|nr:transporter related [Herbinix sp.]